MGRTLRRSADGAIPASELFCCSLSDVFLRWQFRLDERIIKLHGKQRTFHKGGNSSCRLHLRQHYKLYKEKCEEADIPLNHWAIPRDIWRGMEEKRLGKTKAQQVLAFEMVTGPREFTRPNVLEAVAKLIASNNQVRGQH